MEKQQAKTIRTLRTNYVRTGYNRDDILTEHFIESEINYSETGKVLKEVHYTNAETIETLIVNEYNDKDLIVNSIQSDGTQEVEHKTLFYYDKQLRLLRKCERYGAHCPEFCSRYIYEDDLLIREDEYYGGFRSNTAKSYKYDEQKRLIELIEYNEDEEIIYRTTHQYNEQNWVCRTHREEVQENDSRTFVYEYDEAGHKTKELLYNYDHKLIAKGYYQYDEHGNCIEMEEEDLDNYRKTLYAYEGSLCKKITQYDKANVIQSWTEYTYDEAGRITRIQNNICDEVSPNEYRIASIITYETEWY